MGSQCQLKTNGHCWPTINAVQIRCLPRHLNVFFFFFHLTLIICCPFQANEKLKWYLNICSKKATWAERNVADNLSMIFPLPYGIWFLKMKSCFEARRATVSCCLCERDSALLPAVSDQRVPVVTELPHCPLQAETHEMDGTCSKSRLCTPVNV